MGRGGALANRPAWCTFSAALTHKDRKARLSKKFSAYHGKIAIQGLLERHGEVRARVVGNTGFQALQEGVREHVHPGTNVYTDEARHYRDLNEDGFVHQFVHHAERYVDGKVHTNGLENFWSLLKRGLNGTYVSVEPFHLFRYVDEQAFRYNNRKDTDNPKKLKSDLDRFRAVMAQVGGKRLTYKQLTGKEAEIAS